MSKVVLYFRRERLIILKYHHYQYQLQLLQCQILGFGTGAAVADIDNDGILELLVSHGESKAQPLTLYKAKVEKK